MKPFNIPHLAARLAAPVAGRVGLSAVNTLAD